MMYLLDTNICIYLIRRKPIQVLHRFQQIKIGSIGISSITFSELTFGAQKSQFPEKNLQALEKFTIPLKTLPYDTKAAYIYGKIRKELESKGQPIGSMDTLIAAHAVSINCILVTNNEKEFNKVPDLQVENWITQKK